MFDTNVVAKRVKVHTCKSLPWVFLLLLFILKELQISFGINSCILQMQQDGQDDLRPSINIYDILKGSVSGTVPGGRTSEGETSEWKKGDWAPLWQPMEKGKQMRTTSDAKWREWSAVCEGTTALCRGLQTFELYQLKVDVGMLNIVKNYWADISSVLTTFHQSRGHGGTFLLWQKVNTWNVSSIILHGV